MLDPVTAELVELALREDLAGYGDITSMWTVDAEAEARAWIVAREDAVVSGLALAAAVMNRVDAEAEFESLEAEGAELTAGGVLAEISGRARSLLMAERTMLNFLRHLCGVATQARRFARAVQGTEALVVDTRKTSPGLRVWEKKAVRDGGCGNHRFGLFDMVLIKDNHATAGGGIGATVRRAKALAPFSMKVEAEVQDEVGLREAIAAGADIVMLDNMSVEEMTRCVGIARELERRVLLEASGRIDLKSVGAVARTGVDLISASALTTGAPPVDLGLDFVGKHEEGPCC
ncbi:MAG: carboxylating nicotinate-nucleotide diphosphorylase [Actinobacteria bacterium]|nr:carboxylating nicotinate-nucleotide diphosphorylase [Actinomycetota bacterium]